MVHLLLYCVYNREFWFLMLWHLGLQRFTPPTDVTELVDWWLPCRKLLLKQLRKQFDTLVVLGCLLLWLERNSRVFCRSSQRPRQLLAQFQEEAVAWTAAGFVVLSDVI
jgi:hypothetical protein